MLYELSADDRKRRQGSTERETETTKIRTPHNFTGNKISTHQSSTISLLVFSDSKLSVYFPCGCNKSLSISILRLLLEATAINYEFNNLMRKCF